MKKSALIVFLVTLTTSLFSQIDTTRKMVAPDAGSPAALKLAEEIKKEESTSKHISFIIGPGASLITDRIYDDPAVNPSTNAVVIQNGPRMKTNLAIGIAYTPKVITYTRTKKGFDKAGNLVDITDVTESYAGQTFTAFINPITFSSSSDAQPFLKMIDFGVGWGYRFKGGLLLMVNAEFFSIRQPRDWFIEQFKDKNLPYLVENAPQKSIDTKDNNLFTNKGLITLGFKACYTFDVIRSFIAGSQIKPADQ